MTPNNEHINEFINYLQTQQGLSGRALLAKLRRTVANPLNTYSAALLLGDKLPNSDDWDFDAYLITAVLFAINATKLWECDDKLQIAIFHKDEQRRSFGSSLRLFRKQLSVGQESLDMRVEALIDASRENLFESLWRLSQRIMSADRDIAIDYAQLLADLIQWDDDDEVRRRWPREYSSRYILDSKATEFILIIP